MRKLVKSVGFNEERARLLQDKSTELIVKGKVPVKESEIIHFMVDNMLDFIGIDDLGMYVIESTESGSEKTARKGKTVTTEWRKTTRGGRKEMKS